MRDSTPRTIGLLVAAALALAGTACSDGDDASPATSTTRAAAKTTLTFAGDPELDGELSDADVTCSFPSVDGLAISVFARASNPRYTYRLSVREDTVTVHVDSGAGETFRERNFQGTGVSGFDAARGARLDAELTETAPTPGVDAGAIGTVTGVRGTLDCGHQTPGSSTITVTGDTPTGRYEGARLDPVNVGCYPSAGEVTAIGIANAGPTRVLLLVSLDSDGIVTVEEAPPDVTPRYYGSDPGSATVTASGGTVAADVVEQDAERSHTLRIDGGLVCGRPTRD
jgi:hypothetical protein